jgi:hypothetical protein
LASVNKSALRVAEVTRRQLPTAYQPISITIAMEMPSLQNTTRGRTNIRQRKTNSLTYDDWEGQLVAGRKENREE